jgi:phage/plasmid-associated DNA primase
MNNNCNSSNNDLNEEIQENTVEYKIINNYNKHINILNKIYYEQNDKYKQLMDFLKEFKLEKESKIDSNITAPTGKYYIKPHIRTRFFEKLKDCCINDKLTLHFRERQHSDFDKKEGSGIMYDFDLFQDSDKNELHEKPFIELFYIIIKIFIEVIDFKEPLNTYAAIITKKKLVYNEIKKKYKNGFHIIIPGIQLTKQAKILLYNKLLESKDLQIYFAEYFNSPLTTETFDKNSNSVPVYYLYNCKEDSNEPYNLFNMYNIKYKNDLIIAQCSKEDIMNKYNIISELSLNHQAELIEMIYYDLKDEYHQQLLLHQQHFNKFEAEKQRVEATFETERTDADENLDYYKTIVMEILDEKRSESYTSWRDVIYALANINPSAPHKYKSIAEMFSQRNQDKYDAAGFEKLWNEAINSNSANKLTVASLIRWAMEDNKTKYNSLLSKDIKNTISHDVFYSENRVLNGQLYQYHFAYYIYHLFKHKFVCDITKKDTEWYEFVLDRDAHTKGQVYKWRREIRPDNLYLYISNKLPDKINKVIETAEEQVKKHPEKAEQNDYITNRIQKLRSSAQKLYTTEFKKGIIREAEVLFRKRGFINSLNTDQNVMGVGNGVLELSNTPRLIRNFHDHPITLFTDIDYEKYDPLNPNTKLLINGLKDLFPHDEQDAFHYLMYYLASCLDGKPKDSMIFIITGNGCHAKDSLIRMFDGNIKKIQDIQVGELVMGDDNTPREVLELYRGKDKMVKITPKKEKSFIVNINHVLSLKFTNLITIIKRNDSYYRYKEAYRIIWYEYNGLDEPIRKSKTLSSKLLCEEFKLTLFNDKKVIKKGDIIDIKVKNLLTWNKWWLNKSNILLYKSEKLEYSDKDLSIDPYILGYWLGDGTSCRMQITTADNKIVKAFTSKLKDYEVSKDSHNKYGYTIKDNSKSNSNQLLNKFRNYDLINNKHIPFDFKVSSVNQRLQLLAGILDSDGNYQKSSNQYELTLKDEKLFDDCLELVTSLGFIGFKKEISKYCMYKGEKRENTYYRMQIYGDGIENIPCILTRKQAEIRKKQKNPNLDSFSIELLGEDDYYGFELDKNHRYLTADGFVHHNSNGKSFLAELVKSVLGNYGKKMPLSFLTDSRSKAAGADPSLMELKTARLAYYSESNKHEVLNTAKLKEITSQETLSGRGLYEEQSQFRPVCHHMVTTNYHFAIKTTDHGIWRRIVTYEFKILFTPNPNPDNKYEKKENTKFAQEFTYNDEIKKSFLSILVEYYKDLHTNHGGSLKNIMKPTIDKESNKYRNKEDIINRFIDDVCIYSPGNKTCLSELIDKYESWYEFNVDKTGTPIKSEIEKQLENSKLTKFIEKTLSSRILKDIRILEDSLDEDILSANEKLLKDMVDNSKLSYVEYNISHFNPLQI